jgi:uncharacterized protein (DUF885 family)
MKWLALPLVAIVALARPVHGQTLDEIVKADWAWRLTAYPELATFVGVHDHDDRLARVDEVAQQQALAHYRDVARSVAALDLDRLSIEDRVSARVLAVEARDRIAAIELHEYLMPMNGDSSFFGDLTELPRMHEFKNVQDYRMYIQRLRDIPRFFDENIALMREGMKRKLTLPQVILNGRDAAARAQAKLAAPDKSPFYAPFIRMPATISSTDAAKLRADGAAAIQDAVMPAYAKVATFLATTYIPAARQTIAATDLPDGKAFYRAAIREHVGLDMTPEEIHALGLREVARIRAEMEAVKTQVGFAGGLPAFMDELRHDPQFYAKTPEELLMRAARIAKRIDAKLPRYFGILPRQTYGVEPVPDAIAPFYTGGRYVAGPPGTSGTYWVNTYDLPSRPLYVLPALTLHEAVPGHHLQGALAAEKTDLPPFRRHASFSVTGEGWGLYAEHLGEEMGIYQTPHEEFGRLTYEMWRACRLVVDTGIHALGWSREKARAYLKENTALSEHEIETETDRYIGWPGQALSYKIGELKIRELRSRAERALDERFDLRAFHDAVLGLGSVPLPVLEDEIDRFIEASKAK